MDRRGQAKELRTRGQEGPVTIELKYCEDVPALSEEAVGRIVSMFDAAGATSGVEFEQIFAIEILKLIERDDVATAHESLDRTRH